MRRSLCSIEPSYALAGQVTNWTFTYTPSSTLAKGAKLKFDLLSQGREIDWEVPAIESKDDNNLIFARYEDGKVLQPKQVKVPDSLVPQYEFTLSKEIKSGQTLQIVLGSSDEKKKLEKGNRAQCTMGRRKSFLLYVDSKGNGNYDDPEVFSIDIRGNDLHLIQILAPAFTIKNKRFDVVLRFEDLYGNLTSRAPEETLLELTYENLRENLNWKLFVPETGFITLPNFYFNEEGTYTIKLTDTYGKKTFTSSPIRCFAEGENDKNLYWGLLHGESERVDSTENIDSCLRYFRDDRALNFFSTSSFEHSDETSAEEWKLISQSIAEFNEDDRFVSFLGFQWNGDPLKEGIRQLIYSKDSKPILRKQDAKNNSLKKIYKMSSPKELVSIPCFTMGKGSEFDFKNHQAEFEPVVEIYNAWGSSEGKENNLRPISTAGKSGVKLAQEGSIVEALKDNCRFGFVAGGLDDRGVYADFYDSEQEQYSPGLTAIIANTHSRQSLIEALYARSCYATTGARILLGFHIAGISMGQEVSTQAKPGLVVNRHISVYTAGTTWIQKVELFRNGSLLKTFTCENQTKVFEFTYDDMEDLKSIYLQSPDKKTQFVFYYLRVLQEDGHIAWSSPIWIDLHQKKERAAVKKVASKG